jgi:dinuclear metal center YbgI/SA1388 family protein
MIVKDVTKYLEKIAPLHLQESYDNSGLQVGDYKSEVKGILVSLDVTLEVIDDAINQQCNLIVAHHPIIFGEIKNVTKSSLTGSIVFKAIKNNINIYAIHTNLDNVPNGVNSKIAEVIGLKRKKILLPKQNLLKLVVFVPESHSEKVSQALFRSGAGNIGNYKNCIFSSTGEGSFLPKSGSNPYMGKKGKLEKVKEEKLEVVFPDYLLSNIIQSMNSAHPYEEVAYDIFKLLNNSNTGSGMLGELEKPTDELEFLNLIKKKFHAAGLRHTKLINRPIKKVAICGGSGSFLLKNAMLENADIFITSDYKYHQFFEAENKILIADIGHYESEQFTIDLISEFLMKKFTNFAIRLTTVNTNPINYL